MRKPEWLKIDRPVKSESIKTENILSRLDVNTVCSNACCPNKTECYKSGTATFLLLGTTCTRNCTFCAIDKDLSKLTPPNPLEPEKIASAINELGIDYAVLTMVTRDDLSDGGASHLLEVIKMIREVCEKSIEIEVLVSDFNGCFESVKLVLSEKPDVFNHNVETVPRLYPMIRPKAEYQRSMNILKMAKSLAPSVTTKSGLMVGLGETEEEVFSLIIDMITHNVDILTIGQYLRPSKEHHPVVEYVRPETFEKYRQYGLNAGLKAVVAGPFVRSSYKAKYARDIVNTH